ncbi:MAG: TIGR02221 family CRISPR-associated protein [Anaerolineae bacterium]|nr:TIGR02221 family CRISPR-associated protein [Anaerolineales bacterium]MCQ3980754.1 TIGR02221 family CRISPR-associated protein [Anaerolineae bacterium]
MNLLTFLGTADYKETTYTLAGQRHTTCYCPAAIAHFYRPETTLVVVTQKAKDKHFESLADEIVAVTHPVELVIPESHSEADLWDIFNALTAKVQAGDELIVDITNGFRSLPFLSFLAIAFLRMARRVNVRHVYYGAFEAKNEANESPVFDLTPFVTLLDWTIATDRFTRFGDATDLAGLLRQGMPPGPLMNSDLQAREVGNGLKGAAKAMEEVSLALRLTRPLETMSASDTLVNILRQTTPTITQKTPPFGLLAEQIRSAYEPLAQSDPLTQSNWPENLAIQLDLISWYLDKSQVVQALTLAREWLVSALVYHFGLKSLINYEVDRKPVENALNNEVERHKPNPRLPLRPALDDQLRTMSNHREIGKLWDKLTELRNDIAHVGMNLNPKKADRLRKEAQDIFPRLQTLAESLEIIPPTQNSTEEAVQ